MSQKPYWEMTPEEIPCGRCDREPAGRGAAVADHGGSLIVACAACLGVLRKEEAARRAQGPSEGPGRRGTRGETARGRSGAEAA